jgi:hypothetical protein
VEELDLLLVSINMVPPPVLCEVVKLLGVLVDGVVSLSHVEEL